jgi:histidinol-phosphatase (PHP family)
LTGSGEFCKHAHGTLEKVVTEALDRGFSAYGMSEHVPRYKTRDLYPEESNMTTADLERQFDMYIVEARRLQNKYKGKIELFVGAETEFIDQESLTKTLELKKRLDYLVGSVHHVCCMPIDFDVPTRKALLHHVETEKLSDNAREYLQMSYYDAQLEMLQALKPEVVGHFDLIQLFDDDYSISDLVWDKIKRNIEWIIKHESLVEINSRAYKKHLAGAYPQKRILEVCVE